MKHSANKHGVTINSKIIKNGNTDENILNFAEHHVDLIIMGRKNLTFLMKKCIITVLWKVCLGMQNAHF
jgi:ABC-type uncharacterized transport system substrate-binding protein